MKLFSNDESVTESGCTQFKEASPQVRLSCFDEDLKRHDGKSVPKDLLRLHSLVANPHTEEHVWMNACIGAGDKSLEPSHGLLQKVWTNLTAWSGGACSFVSVMFYFSVSLFLFGQTVNLFGGMSVDNFLRPFSTADGVGLLVSLTSSLCFWTSLVVRSQVVRLLVLVPSLLMIWGLLAFGLSTQIGTLSGIVVAILATVSVSAIAGAGWQCRQSLPRSFSPAKMASAGLPVLILPTSLSTWVLYMAATQERHSGAYSDATTGVFFFLSAIFAYCFFAHGYAIARASKSVSVAAGAFLSTLVQAPLLVGLFFAGALSAVFALIGDNPISGSAMDIALWKQLGLQRFAFFTVGLLAACCLSGAGGYAGAMLNAKLSKK